jgi:hypothetical protein
MKLVKEYINFERGLNPKDAMGIGIPKFKNIQKGDVFKLKKDIKSFGYDKGDIIYVKHILSYNGNPDLEVTIFTPKYEIKYIVPQWEWPEDFFNEYIKYIGHFEPDKIKKMKNES